MNQPYYFAVNNQQVGPLDAAAIKRFIAEGKVSAATLTWCQGMGTWQPVSNVPELLREFGNLLASKAAPPPLPTNLSGAQTPPPLPQGDSVPPGLSSMDAAAYRFVQVGFRPWGGRSNFVHDYVKKDPKRALPVTIASIAVMAAIVFYMASLSNEKKQVAQNPGQAQPTQQAQMSGPGLGAAYQAQLDAQRYTSQVIDDVYEYKRDAGDRMDETYRRANYDWYRDNDD